MNYIGGLVAAWTAMNARQNKGLNTNLKMNKFVVYWLLFCLGFMLTQLIYLLFLK